MTRRHLFTEAHYLLSIKAAYFSRFRHYCHELIALYRRDYPNRARNRANLHRHRFSDLTKRHTTNLPRHV